MDPTSPERQTWDLLMHSPLSEVKNHSFICSCEKKLSASSNLHIPYCLDPMKCGRWHPQVFELGTIEQKMFCFLLQLYSSGTISTLVRSLARIPQSSASDRSCPQIPIVSCLVTFSGRYLFYNIYPLSTPSPCRQTLYFTTPPPRPSTLL